MTRVADAAAVRRRSLKQTATKTMYWSDDGTSTERHGPRRQDVQVIVIDDDEHVTRRRHQTPLRLVKTILVMAIPTTRDAALVVYTSVSQFIYRQM